jgi:hypothetical protein
MPRGVAAMPRGVAAMPRGVAAMAAARSPRHPPQRFAGWTVGGSGSGRQPARRCPLGGEHGRGTHPERGVRTALVVVLLPV